MTIALMDFRFYDSLKRKNKEIKRYRLACNKAIEFAKLPRSEIEALEFQSNMEKVLNGRRAKWPKK